MTKRVSFLSLLLFTLLVGCARVSHRAQARVLPFQLTPTNVIVYVPCATLTPFTDYRDFMDIDEIASSSNVVLLGHQSPGATPYPTDAEVPLLPPAEATLIFNDDCQ